MEIIKYSIAEESRVTEFGTYADAQAYKTANNLSAEIVEVVEQVPEDAPIPDVTPRQIRQALLLSGVSLTDITNALESLSEPTKSLAITEWEYSITFQRNRPLVASVGVMLGWTPEQLDNLWLFAGTL